MYSKILLASDGSPHAERAGKEAIKLASLYQGNVTVLYVNPHSRDKGKLNEELEKIQKRLEMTEANLKSANVTYQVEVLEGEPGPSIVTYANNNAYDILVIGSRGLNDFQGMVLGSVSHKVAKRTHCPVLVIK